MSIQEHNQKTKMFQPTTRAMRTLALEYESLQLEPVEGFRITLFDDNNMFNWEVAIYGPPDTIYQGGYFKAEMQFPADYPYNPPSVHFLNTFWHPNVYRNGDLCISILHPPVDDPYSDELASERWNPAQNVRTILLSVISLLNEPNTSSPANVDASVMYKSWKQSKGKDNSYEAVVRRQVEASKQIAAKDGVVVPVTIEDYCRMGATPLRPSDENDDIASMQFYATVYEDDVSDEEDDDAEEDYDNGEEDDDNGEKNDEEGGGNFDEGHDQGNASQADCGYNISSH